MKHRLICAFLVCLVLSGLIPFAHAENSDGVIRLLLTKTEATDQIAISLDGSYSIGTTVFQRGAAVKIAIRDQSLFLYHEGISMYCGNNLVLTRHALADGDASENGLRFNGQYPLFPGDLHITIQGQSLRLILYIPLEEYLWGVVPYEMSDSWPLEALKAQAIAARTYALYKKRGSTYDYDLMDNTNDQAFYGIQGEHQNALKAIKSTEGIIGIDGDGSAAKCYYSASNGGRTETLSAVWAMPDVSYLVQKEDPYDLNNPAATVRICEIPKDLSALPGLKQAILEKVRRVLEQTGNLLEDVKDSDLVRLAEISQNTSGDSYIFTAMVNTVQEANNDEEAEIYYGIPQDPTNKSAMAAQVPVRIVFTVFPEIETLCDLDINRGTPNEIITLRETSASFVFESRRFGHGVGMSQRGAQWMADHEGMNCDEILAFYYPGLHFGRMHLQARPTPTAVSLDFLMTPGPPASPTPRPTLMPITQSAAEGKYIVSVDNISAGSYLNLRSEPGMNGIVLRQLYYGQQLVVLEETNDGWLHVKTDSCEGYVMRSYVKEIP